LVVAVRMATVLCGRAEPKASVESSGLATHVGLTAQAIISSALRAFPTLDSETDSRIRQASLPHVFHRKTKSLSEASDRLLQNLVFRAF
jgi:hypothetical protein